MFHLKRLLRSKKKQKNMYTKTVIPVYPPPHFVLEGGIEKALAKGRKKVESVVATSCTHHTAAHGSPSSLTQIDCHGDPAATLSEPDCPVSL